MGSLCLKSLLYELVFSALKSARYEKGGRGMLQLHLKIMVCNAGTSRDNAYISGKYFLVRMRIRSDFSISYRLSALNLKLSVGCFTSGT